MNRAILIAISLATGLVVGVCATLLWPLVLSPTPESFPPVESFLVCKWDTGNRESSLIIKGDTKGVKEIILPWRTEADRFRIDSTTDMHYLGINIEEKRSQVSITEISLNRINGDLSLTERVAPKAMKLLTALCRNEISQRECDAQIAAIGGDGCWSSDDQCRSWLQGNNFRLRANYSCRATDKRF